MEFRTVIHPLKGRQGLVNHGNPVLLIGSCFSDNIGRSLSDDLFDVCVNPFGPIYNPLSIRRAIEALADGAEVDSGSLFERDGLYHSFMFHSKWSGEGRDVTAAGMTCSISEGNDALHRAQVVIITLGTTRVFIHRATGAVVANCHKLPGNEFEIRYMDIDEVSAAMSETVEIIGRCNPGAHVIFTVSPLRYTELGAHGNQLSKSTLLLAVDRVVQKYGHVSYFPAYEIMMDDLRDYRFYADDMKHPSQQAVNYIYEIFRDSYFAPATVMIAAEARGLTRRLSHRIMTASGEAAGREASARLAAVEEIINRHPELTGVCSRRYINTLFKQE